MKIGIIGAGNIARAVGLLWTRAGHEIRFGTRHPETLAALVQSAGARASAGTASAAAAFGEIVFCSTPYGAWPEIAAALAPLLSGKIVIDSANPYPERDGDFARHALAAGEGAGVPVARLLPGARFVRAFNSVYFRTLETEAHRAGDRVGIPIAGDDAAAMHRVADLVRDAGFAPVIVGPLLRARDFDPGTPVYNTGLSGPDLARALGLSPDLEENTRLVLGHFEDFVNKRDLDAIGRNLDPAFVDHDGPGGRVVDRAADRAMMARMHQLFPDLRVVVKDSVAQGDKVVVRNLWTGTHAQTGQRMEFHGFVMWRIPAGKIVERWATVTPMHEITAQALEW